MKECMLTPDKSCNECGKCEICDLDEAKLCNNCCQCLGDADYKAIEITEIIMPKEVKIKRKKPKKQLNI